MAKRRHVLAGVAALATFGAVVGSAATLGGITSASLGADASVVAGCDPNGITVSYTTSFCRRRLLRLRRHLGWRRRRL